MPKFTMEVIRTERTLITIEEDTEQDAIDAYDEDPGSYNGEFEFIATEEVDPRYDTIKDLPKESEGNDFDLKCPECGNTEGFAAGGYASLSIVGSRITGEDFDWDKDSSMSCGLGTKAGVFVAVGRVLRSL